MVLRDSLFFKEHLVVVVVVFFFLSTAQPLHNGHLRDRRKWPFEERWPLWGVIRGVIRQFC